MAAALAQLLSRIDIFLARDTTGEFDHVVGLDLAEAYRLANAMKPSAPPKPPEGPAEEAPDRAATIDAEPHPATALLHRSKTSKSGYEGVYVSGPNSFAARAPASATDRTLVYLGSYPSAEAAAWIRWRHFKDHGIPYGMLAAEMEEMARIHPGLDDDKLIKLCCYNRILMPGVFPPLVDQDGYQLTCDDYATKGFDAELVRTPTPLVGLSPPSEVMVDRRRPGRPRKTS